MFSDQGPLECQWRPSLRSYHGRQTTAEKEYWTQKRRINLLAEARQAASWGVPGRESVGYSQSDLCAIIHRLVAYIEQS